LAEIEGPGGGETSATVARRVAAARDFARERTARAKTRDARGLEERSGLSERARRLLRQALANECLGGRGYARVIRLARTIADLDGSPSVEVEHVGEALALRLEQRRIGVS
jgi:magnesium chelatase family protein